MRTVYSAKMHWQMCRLRNYNRMMMHVSLQDIYVYGRRVKVCVCVGVHNLYQSPGMALSLGDKVNAAQKQTATGDGSQSRSKAHTVVDDGENEKKVNGVVNGDRD